MKNLPILLKGVSVHNLKKVNLSLKPGELVVFTGVSGSGKSSLAFDTIYAEGQRRYLESLSHQSRRHLAELPKPDAESISGIAPTVAIEQKLATKTPRSTVGTLTGIYDFLRVVYARIGTPYCPISKKPLEAQSQEKMISQISHLPKGTLLFFLAPYARNKKGEFQEDFKDLMKKGFTRLRVDTAWVELGEIQGLDPKTAHDVDIVIDRFKLDETNSQRIKEAVSASLDSGKGMFILHQPDEKEETLFSQTAYSEKADRSYPPLEPHHFSFNHPEGMCKGCQGLGTAFAFDLDKIIDPDKSIADDACLLAPSYQTIRYGNIYTNLARIYKFKVTTPWKHLPEDAKQAFLYGTEKKWTRMSFVHPEKNTKWTEFVQWKGVLHEANEKLAQAKSDAYRKKMEELKVEGPCPTCQGARIQAYPAETRLGGLKISEVTALSLEDAFSFFHTLSLSKVELQIAKELIQEITDRLHFLKEVGLSYLSLNRTSPTLSGGESQRVRLAAQIGAGLVGAIYVLDEPSIGLHPADHHKLIRTLFQLRDQGNTVLVVEHDTDTILAADRIVDVGPGAGSQGGNILSSGSLEDLLQNKESLTAKYLSGELQIQEKRTRRLPSSKRLFLQGASHHNLHAVDVMIPLGVFVCVTGLSGSGKSSLIADTLYPALANHFHRAKLKTGAYTKLEGLEHLDKVIAVDQSPIGRTPRSNPATYIKLLDDIRDLFAELPESKAQGLHAGHFSFNVKEGSCSYCSGMGSVRMDMDFLEDIWVMCPQCKGKRFEPEILTLLFKGSSMADVLDMDVEQALHLFESIPPIRKKLDILKQVGLGYLTLGQSSTTLSGGEAQRIKLAKELVRPASGNTLYILDEPTTGLHFHDIKKLVEILQNLIDKGNSVLVIEHNLDLIKLSDWVIDLGPGAGIHGGSLVGEGPPENISTLSTPTGRALKGLPPTLKTAPLQNLSLSTIQIKHANENNLKSVSVSIPRNKMTVFTGPSGSGKTSLAFDTLYAEGQRRYVETLSPYARSLVKQLPKPKVDQIIGLPPAIALEQKTGGLNPRSTVGTVTEVYDLLRLLYAHLGIAYCPETKEKIEHINKESVVEKILTLDKGEKILVLSPFKMEKKESFEQALDRIRQLGFLRIRLNGILHEVDDPIVFEKHKKNDLYLVIDRLVVQPHHQERMLDAVQKASQLSEGIVVIAKEQQDLYFNLSFAVPRTGKSYPSITPQTFSFNHETGMCLECQGLGSTYGAHLASHSAFLKLSLEDVCIRLFKEKGSSPAYSILERYFSSCGISMEEKLKHLSEPQLTLILQGGPEIYIKKHGYLNWIGLEKVFGFLAHSGSKLIKEPLLPLLQQDLCSSCKGSRLNPLASHVRIQNTSIYEFCSLSIDQALLFIQKLPMDQTSFLKDIRLDIEKHLQFLIKIGLEYLSLNRSMPTLSGGEVQRVRLARQLGSGLTSCLYVLDEPTIGLHPHNNETLNLALQELCELGNTLVLVEHDPMTILAADYLVDFGPKAGALGGTITAQGSIQDILNNPLSLTGGYLSGRTTLPVPVKRRPFSPDLKIEGANLHNLKNVSVAFPLGAITCVTGVSGSGKSTLLRHLLKPALEQVLLSRRKKADVFVYENTRFYGLDCLDKLIIIDQTPIGQTARADVSTYTDIMPLIRSHFAALPVAKTQGLQGAHFSPNHLRGMCRSCMGLGYKTIHLQFLPSTKISCEACQSYRLNPLSLSVEYKGKHVGNILEMTIEEAILFFDAIPKIVKRLKILERVGLSYLQLGRDIVSLSGGETQRLRLSKELAKRETGKTLYLMDEPTVGLHSEDIKLLLPIFQELANKKNTVILIEHNLDIIAHADYVIDLGPGAGQKGGEVIATGTPEEIAKHPKSKTSKHLNDHLNLLKKNKIQKK